MRFAILDKHLYEKVKDDPGLILDWDVAEIVRTAHPRPRLHARKRRKLEQTLTSALELKKLGLFSV